MKHSAKPNQNGDFPVYISNVKGFAIFMMDQDGIITTWNIGCELMKGFKAEDAIGNHFEMLFPDYLREENYPRKELEHTFNTGRFEGENWRLKKNGDLFWAHVVLTKVLDEDGEFIGYIKITQDHTHRKHLEDSVKNHNQILQQINIELRDAKEKVNKDLDSFIYTASHDLRTPISNMEGLLVELRGHQCYSDSDANSLIDFLQVSVDRLKKTIGELTEINKVQKSIHEESQEIKIDETIEEVSFLIKDLIKRSNASIKAKTEKCPSIFFSPKNLRIILYNLLSNAIKYSSSERTPEICVETDKLEGFYRIIVRDNGLGIEIKDQEKVFSMFKRLHDHVEGTGIGLYMVKRIVDNAGGRIEIESEVDVGTTFRIFLKSQESDKAIT